MIKITTVKDKYGFVPCSVLHFGKTKSLTRGFLGNQDWRKKNTDNSSSSSMSEFNPDLCKFIIQYWSNKYDNIVDPFHGWGTRAVIAKQLKRNYVGYDISKKTINNKIKEIPKTQTTITNTLADIKKEFPNISDSSLELIKKQREQC